MTEKLGEEGEVEVVDHEGEKPCEVLKVGQVETGSPGRRARLHRVVMVAEGKQKLSVLMG